MNTVRFLFLDFQTVGTPLPAIFDIHQFPLELGSTNYTKQSALKRETFSVMALHPAPFCAVGCILIQCTLCWNWHLFEPLKVALDSQCCLRQTEGERLDSFCWVWCIETAKCHLPVPQQGIGQRIECKKGKRANRKGMGIKGHGTSRFPTFHKELQPKSSLYLSC